MFNGSRLAFARRRRGLTKRKLAELVGVSVRSLTGYEAGEQEPGPENLDSLARCLEFPRSFFFGEDIEEIAGASASFRSMSRMTASQRDAAFGAGTLAIRLGRWIASRYDLPTPAIPDLREYPDPDQAAGVLRMAWGLGDRPIGNMVHLLERQGVRVFSLAEDCLEIDAFSLWDNCVPYVFLNTRKSAERSRFDAAHELGHLVLHQHGGPEGREAEEEANGFASSFLMPRTGVSETARLNPSLRGVLEDKGRWKVSAMAYVYRLHKIGLLSEWHYHQLARKLSALGMRRTEVGSDLPVESSQILRKVLDDLKAAGLTKLDLARELDVYPKEIDSAVFGLVLTSLPGGAGGLGAASTREHLKLVKR